MHRALTCLACFVVLLGCEAGGDGNTTTSSSSAGANGGSGGGGGGTGGLGVGVGGSGGNGSICQSPPAAGPQIQLADEFAEHYQVFELGEVPGVPDALGGAMIHPDDPNVLLIAGGSESPQGEIYSIDVERGPCDHIIGFSGTATSIAVTPNVDANLALGPNDVIFYTQWPRFMLSQLPLGDSMSAVDTDLKPLGIADLPDQGPGGVGFVPPPLGAAGELRILTWPDGHWYHVDITPNGEVFDVDALTETRQLSKNPGGFAYVPAGSPGFPEQSLIVSEWVQGNSFEDRVATYEVDDEGDPIVATRKEFFKQFPRPWGAYFEPVTGDYMFLTWGASTPKDLVFIVQGFAPPPPPPQ